MNIPPIRLDKDVALVTGASSGLGAHFSRVLAASGATVIMAARRVQKLEALADQIRQEGGRVFVAEMDVTDETSVSNAIRHATAQAGAISVLINNAGVADAKSFLKLTEQSWHDTLAVNLTGAWRVAHSVTQHMVTTNTRGCVVNIASILGLRVGFGTSAYAASKAAVVQLTQSMALELQSKNIRVNALCPGYVETEINAEYFASEQGQNYIKATPAGRTGTLDELTMPLLLLCSDAGSFVNGVALPVDGGHLISSL